MMVKNKYTRFRDIPQFVREGQWQCSYSPHECLRFIDECVKENGLQLEPDFQRAHVWTEAQQVAWLEFFFRGGKSGRIIYLNHPGWQKSYRGEFVLVDGKQRLQALRRFMGNEIPVFGTYAKDYTDRPNFIDHNILLNVNTLQTREEVLQWYIDMNAGGTPHTKAEIDKVVALLVEERGRLAAEVMERVG